MTILSSRPGEDRTVDITVDYSVDPVEIKFCAGNDTLLIGSLGTGDFKVTDILTILGRLGFALNYTELP